MDAVKNFSTALVLTAPTPADTGTTIVLEAGKGVLFPDPSTDGEYNVVVHPDNTNPITENAEIMRVTARSTDTLTVTRIQEGTTARAIGVGDRISLVVTAKTITDLRQSNAGKNLLINGNFDVWQRGASFSTSGYTADRQNIALIGSSCTVSRQSFALGQEDVPNNPNYFLRADVASVAGAGNLVILRRKLEGVHTLSGSKATYSFWAKADAAKDMTVEFEQNFGSGGSSTVDSIGIAKISLTTSWKKFEITAEIPSINGKTAGAHSTLIAIFWLDAGSDWDLRTDNLGHQSGIFDFSQMKLEAGTIATEFIPFSFSEEHHKCLRYYEKSFNYDIEPADGESAFILPSGALNTTVLDGTVTFAVEKRDTPAMDFYYSADGTPAAGQWSYYKAGWQVGTISGNDVKQRGFGPRVIGTGLTAAGFYAISGHWTADAEL